MLKQFTKYFLAGGIAAIVNFSSRILYDTVLGFNTSLVLAYFTGLLVNYGLSRRYVFAGGREASVAKQSPVFVLVAGAGLAVTWAATLAGLELLGRLMPADSEVAKSGAHIFGIGCGFLANFFGHRSFTFRQRNA